MKRQHYTILVYLLFTIYLVNGLLAIPKLSITVDEPDHFLYGIRVLKGDPDKSRDADDASVMPVSAMNALPRAVEQVFNPTLTRDDGGEHDIMLGRIVTLIISLLTGWYLLRWATEIFGASGGILSLCFFVFCPNLVSNSWLVSTDAFAALATTASAYFFYRFCRYSGWRNFLLFSCWLGIAQISKQSLILLIPFFALVSLVILWQRRTLISRWSINIRRLLVLVVITLLVINIAFLFHGSFSSLNEYQFKTAFFKGLQHQWFSSLPLPLPTSFLEGFDGVKYMLNLGSGHLETSPRSYLFGEYFTGKGPWYYYPALILFKTPLFTLVSTVITLTLVTRKSFRIYWKFLTLPLLMVLFFVVMVVGLNTSQHGLRHLLMIYPLLYLLLGSLSQWNWKHASKLLVAGVAYLIISFYSYYPNLIAYTNELLWNKTNVYKSIASVNIDFGQGGYFLARYLKAHPDARIVTTQPQAGNFVIPINRYLDLEGSGQFAWLRNFTPQQHINHCFLLIKVTEKELQDKGLK